MIPEKELLSVTIAESASTPLAKAARPARQGQNKPQNKKAVLPGTEQNLSPNPEMRNNAQLSQKGQARAQNNAVKNNARHNNQKHKPNKAPNAEKPKNENA